MRHADTSQCRLDAARSKTVGTPDGTPKEKIQEPPDFLQYPAWIPAGRVTSWEPNGQSHHAQPPHPLASLPRPPTPRTLPPPLREDSPANLHSRICNGTLAKRINPFAPLNREKRGRTGLKTSQEWPFAVVDGFACIVDKNFLTQDAPEYCNPLILPGDFILQVDSQEVQSCHDFAWLVHKLDGPIHSTVTITMSRRTSGDRYTVLLLRRSFLIDDDDGKAQVQPVIVPSTPSAAITDPQEPFEKSSVEPFEESPSVPSTNNHAHQTLSLPPPSVLFSAGDLQLEAPLYPVGYMGVAPPFTRPSSESTSSPPPSFAFMDDGLNSMQRISLERDNDERMKLESECLWWERLLEEERERHEQTISLEQEKRRKSGSARSRQSYHWSTRHCAS